MRTRRKDACLNCHRLQQQMAALQAQVEALQCTVRQLQEGLARLRKDSSTSSKPPSSDLVKPPKPPPPPDQPQRSVGGQPGHPHHQRPLLPPEALTGGSQEHRLDCCPTCGHALQAVAASPRVVQQIEILQPPLHIEEHRAVPGWCPACQRVHYAPLPAAIERGQLAGPRLTALIAYLKGACHASYSTIRKFLRDVAGVAISRGQLAKVISKVSRALDQPYQELLEKLPAQARLNVDETGHKDRGEPWWTWCFRAGLYTLFKIDPTRSGDVLLEVLGEEFNGVLGCDYFSAYRRYLRECNAVVQFCLAHLIRDVKFLTTLPDARDRAYGERLREALRALFGVIHRREELGPRVFQRRLTAARDEVLRQAACDVPPTAHSRNLAQRFAQHGEAYFEFVTTPEVEPTNNLAEQAIRFVVIDRHITQGTRGETGRRWCERIWTVLATCAQQGRSAFAYLYDAVVAFFHQTAVPSLLSEGK
ncbi:MAG TPA: IS66 family transposase [Gemmataceae bacterium]|nr:IS66 family transposase [Gemmataceae bacterium]